jgi:hypothetical protein
MSALALAKPQIERGGRPRNGSMSLRATGKHLADQHVRPDSSRA